MLHFIGNRSSPHRDFKPMCESARLFNCLRCNAPVTVCRRCDRGQCYCHAGCRQKACIWLRGLEEFGEAQADTYYLKFIERFELLADTPYLGTTVDEIREGYRRTVCGVDSIFYRIDGDTVEIMAILRMQDTQNRFISN